MSENNYLFCFAKIIKTVTRSKKPPAHSLLNMSMNITFTKKNAIALQGNLSIVTIENLMQLMGHAGLNGELQIQTPTNSALLFVEMGTLIYSYIKNTPLRIGQRLVQGNYITREQLQDCLSLSRNNSSRPRIGRILVAKKYLLQEDLEKVYKEQARDNFFEILSWQTGSFAFIAKKISKNENILLHERIDHLTLEGVCHADELAHSSKSPGLVPIPSSVEAVAGYS